MENIIDGDQNLNFEISRQIVRENLTILTRRGSIGYIESDGYKISRIGAGAQSVCLKVEDDESRVFCMKIANPNSRNLFNPHIEYTDVARFCEKMQDEYKNKLPFYLPQFYYADSHICFQEFIDGHCPSVSQIGGKILNFQYSAVVNGNSLELDIYSHSRYVNIDNFLINKQGIYLVDPVKLAQES